MAPHSNKGKAESLVNKVELSFTREAWDYFWAWIDCVNTEIGGVGYVRKNKDGSLTWWKTLLVPQVVEAASVEFTDQFYIIEQAKKDGVLGNDDFMWGWWHSHAGFNTFWSSTDMDEYIEPFRAAGAQELVSIVGNHEHKYRARLDLFNTGVLPHVGIEDDINVSVEKDEDLLADAWDQADELVKLKPKPKPQTTGYGFSQNGVAAAYAAAQERLAPSQGPGKRVEQFDADDPWHKWDLDDARKGDEPQCTFLASDYPKIAAAWLEYFGQEISREDAESMGLIPKVVVSATVDSKGTVTVNEEAKA